MTIDFRKNAALLTAIHTYAKSRQPTPSDPYVVDGYELHARPELAHRLKNLMSATPEANMDFAYGVPLLCTPGGRAFATAGGTHSLSLLLPEGEGWGEPVPEYGRHWRQGYAWTSGRQHAREDEEKLIRLLRLAYSTAVNMDAA